MEKFITSKNPNDTKLKIFLEDEKFLKTYSKNDEVIDSLFQKTTKFIKEKIGFMNTDDDIISYCQLDFKDFNEKICKNERKSKFYFTFIIFYRRFYRRSRPSLQVLPQLSQGPQG